MTMKTPRLRIVAVNLDQIVTVNLDQIVTVVVNLDRNQDRDQILAQKMTVNQNQIPMRIVIVTVTTMILMLQNQQ